MEEAEILQLRLQNQLLMPDANRSVIEVVEWMGALQAQDYSMMKWGIGCRASGSTDNQVEEALNRGDLLRTHLLRPTWHVVAQKDIRWMLNLTAQRIRDKMKPRDKQLGLSEAIVKKSKSILVKSLEDGIHKTKEEIDACWNRASIPTTEYRDAHLLMHAELDGLVCSGRTIGNSRSYALMEERAPIKEMISKEEALYQLAVRYFKSRWPATLQDFAWWSGLTMGDVRKAVESIRPEFQMETVGERHYILSNNRERPTVSGDIVHLIPAFDEYIIAYRDRSNTLLPAHFQKLVTNNGVFRPALLLNGKVVGIWKKSGKGKDFSVELTPFRPINPEIQTKQQKAITEYGRFLNGTNSFSPFSFK